mmetsp:Transcript_67411/g.185851  ORF Transcript_67411/g.185851 Transcript_67411/m.185851 type:complete len:465 (+) Transcript_67411:10-1404(+)
MGDDMFRHTSNSCNGETPLLKRKDIHFSLTGGNDKIKAKGNVFLTTNRVIFLGNKNGEACEMKLTDIRNEKFNQPLFGANNISGTLEVPPTVQKWKLTFNSGGIGTFLHTFNQSIAGARARGSLPQTVTAEAEAVPMADASYMAATAALPAMFDPSDPAERWEAQATPHPTQGTAGAAAASYIAPARNQQLAPAAMPVEVVTQMDEPLVAVGGPTTPITTSTEPAVVDQTAANQAASATAAELAEVQQEIARLESEMKAEEEEIARLEAEKSEAVQSEEYLKAAEIKKKLTKARQRTASITETQQAHQRTASQSALTLEVFNGAIAAAAAAGQPSDPLQPMTAVAAPAHAPCGQGRNLDAMGVITSGEVASSRQIGPAMAVEAVLVPEGNNVETAMAISTNTNLDETRRRISVNDTDWCQAERSTLGEHHPDEVERRRVARSGGGDGAHLAGEMGVTMLLLGTL